MRFNNTLIIPFITFLLIIVQTNNTQAQLSGTYLVDPSGGGQYSTISAAVNDLNNKGVNGAVTINIASGTYTEQCIIDSITGVSTTNTITIRSSTGNAADVIWEYTAPASHSDHVLRIQYTDYLSIEGITFRANDNKHNTCLSFHGGVTNLTIADNVLISDYTSTGSTMISSTYLLDSVTINFSGNTNWEIRNNHFQNGRIGFYAFGAAVMLNDLTFENNLFDTVSQNCITLLGASDIFIENNKKNTAVTGDIAIQLNSCTGRFSITGNEILDSDEALHVAYCSANFNDPGIVANNFFQSDNTALSITTSKNFEVYHNTCRSENNLGAYFSVSDSLKIINNIFYSENSDAAVGYFSAVPKLASDHNAYYSASSDSIIYFSSVWTYYDDVQDIISNLGTDSNSLEIDPVFVGPFDLHVTAQGLKNAGKPLPSVTVDIDGEPRDPFAPDIGADEIQAVANIIPDSLSVTPSGLKAGEGVQVSWFAKNHGDAKVTGPWEDAVYLSKDSQLSTNDLLLGTTENKFDLFAGSSYSNTGSFILPEDSSGAFYLIVHVDNNQILPEDKIDNILASQSYTIVIPDRPDLVVDSVWGPAQTFSGKKFELSWQVRNAGNEPTQVQWLDKVYFSSDSGYLTGKDFVIDSLVVGSDDNPVGLQPGETYTGKTIITPPLKISGNYYYKVVTDVNDVVSEMKEGHQDNGAVSKPVQIIQSPLPDLVIEKVTVPQTTFSGEKVIVSYTVKNIGNAPTLQDYWKDRIYISDDSAQGLGSSGNISIATWGSAIRLAKHYHSSELSPGGSYTVNDTLRVPACISGKYYLYFFADSYLESFESIGGNNLFRSDSINVILKPQPDLEVAQMNVLTPNPASGKPFEVEITVNNNGPASTDPFDDWRDYIFLSRIDTFNSDSAIAVGWQYRDQQVDSNDSYQFTRTCAVPDSVVGDYYLYVYTDKADNVCEGIFETNNIKRSASTINFSLTPPPDLQVTQVKPDKLQFSAGEQIALTFTVQNKGTGTTPDSIWTDYIYFAHKDSTLKKEHLLRKLSHVGSLMVNGSYTETVYVNTPYKIPAGDYKFYVHTDKKDVVFEHNKEGNNRTASMNCPVTVDPEALSDLTVTNISFSSPGNSGEWLTVNFTVKNDNPSKTGASAWYDIIRIKDQNDKYITGRKIYRLGALDSQESYQVQNDIFLPNGRSGNFTLEVETDSMDKVLEYEEQNNLASQTLKVNLSPWPDLNVNFIHSDTLVLAGQKLLGSYIIDNSGSGDAVDTLWYDNAYLSKDPILDKHDILLNKTKRTKAVAAGNNYQQSFHERVPLYISGDYLLIIETDANDDVYEHTAEQNNYSVSSQYITILQPKPADLVPLADSLKYLTSPFPQVEYTIWNNSTNPAIGSREDQLYLSADKQWDKEDKLMFEYTTSYDTIPAGAYQEKSHSAHFPLVKPGYYHLILKVDAYNYIPETNLLNNTITYVDSIYLDNVPKMTPDSTHTGWFAGSIRSDYWQLPVPSNKAVLLEMWNNDFIFPYNPVYPYLRHEDLPTLGEYDYKYEHPFQTEQEVIVPSKGARTDFILARGNTAGVFLPDSMEYKIRAEFKDFGVHTYFPKEGSRYGKIVMDIHGFDFNDTMQATLYNNSDTIIAENFYYLNSTFVRAHFNLTLRDTGTYDLMLTKLDSNISTKVDSAFKVLPEGLPHPWTDVVTPGFARIDEATVANVYYGNSGPANRYDLHLVVAVYHESKDPDMVEVEFMGDNMNHYFDPEEDPNPPSDSAFFLHDSIYFYAVWFPNLPAYSSGNLSFNVKSKTGGITHVRAFYVIQAPSYYSLTGDLEALYTSNSFLLRDSLLAESLGALQNPGNGLKMAGVCNPEELEFENAVDSVKQNTIALAQYLGAPDPKGMAEDGIVDYISNNVVGKNAKIAVDMAAGANDRWAFATDLKDVQDNPFFKRQIETIGDCLDFDGKTATKCIKIGHVKNSRTGKKYKVIINTCDYESEPYDGGGSDGGWIESILPDDPNEIVGPSGEGDLRFVRKDEKMNYTIYFENKPTATAPAQTVRINIPLHKNFRLQDFRLKQIGFGDTVINLGKVAHLQKNIPLGPEYNNLELSITAGANYGSGQAFWILKTIDPNTGTTPVDPTAGFLPPNDSTGIGQGFVTYEITLKDTTGSGTVIDNQATIIFDSEAPLSTNIWENVVAGNKPVSAVHALPQQVSTTSFKVTWEGTDGIPFGTGLKGYDVYVSENGKPYEQWQKMTTSTAAVFTGEKDSTYRFFSIAEDMTGVREAAPDTADATVTIKITGLENELEKSSEINWTVYPNPFSEHLRIDYIIPDPGSVSIELFDLYGKLIRKPVEGYHNPGEYNFTIDARQWGLSPGVYLLILKKDSEVYSRKVIHVE